MIQAMIFDLDGTLVQTERLKAISYARAAVELCPYDLQEDEVVEAFKSVVGLSRRNVAKTLIKKFNLTAAAEERMCEFEVHTPWQAFVQVRMQFYNHMLSDPEVISNNQWPYTMDLLHQARLTYCKVGLATMSLCQQVQRVLQVLELSDVFDFVASRDDVEYGKPDPEIYQLVSEELNVGPSSCLVIEDSPTGVRAALAAGMHVVAVSTPFTRRGLHESALLPATHIVDEPENLVRVVGEIINKEKDS
jgi:beta-phosphoglucomutase-like phosphatase (HAD superfamily)